MWVRKLVTTGAAPLRVVSVIGWKPLRGQWIAIVYSRQSEGLAPRRRWMWIKRRQADTRGEENDRRRRGSVGTCEGVCKVVPVTKSWFNEYQTPKWNIGGYSLQIVWYLLMLHSNGEGVVGICSRHSGSPLMIKPISSADVCSDIPQKRPEGFPPETLAVISEAGSSHMTHTCWDTQMWRKQSPHPFDAC